MNFEYGNFKFRVDGARPLFVAVSGAHAYGTARPDSDLDVRAVRIPSLDWALALSRDESAIRKVGDVDVVEYNLYHFLNVLLHGNATFLENVCQEHVYEDSCFPEFKKLVLEHGLSKRMANHFHGFMQSTLKDYAKKKKIKQLLYGYRVYLTGQHFFESNGEILYSFNELLPFASYPTERNIQELLEMYHTEADEIMPNRGLARCVVNDLTIKKCLFGQFDRVTRKFVPSVTVERSSLPEAPRYGPFNEWLKTLLLKQAFAERTIFSQEP